MRSQESPSGNSVVSTEKTGGHGSGLKTNRINTESTLATFRSAVSANGRRIRLTIAQNWQTAERVLLLFRCYHVSKSGPEKTCSPRQFRRIGERRIDVVNAERGIADQDLVLGGALGKIVKYRCDWNPGIRCTDLATADTWATAKEPLPRHHTSSLLGTAVSK